MFVAFVRAFKTPDLRKKLLFTLGIIVVYRIGTHVPILRYVLNRITWPGSLYLALIALVPTIALATTGASQNFPFGGTSILIIVGVGLETVRQIESQLQQRHYEGFLR
ncbi:hypothetical protein [Streptomyces brasiliensis]|uniref:Preprotein translocase subunit SecY n=1 Tax=Streptomyces brasiliensis TaxID=1954 RepID=A0A917LE11_9ACTN|nr:hypothetical protein [Streptomyces brasiliensis]GGJ58010.1 hypothetical protein GCM10010121_080840 [Streptomyces brasiliensis]